MWNKITSFFGKKEESQQQEYMQDNANYNEQPQFQQAHSSGPESIRLLKPVQKQKKVVAVIVSFCSGSSYDHLFTSVQQKAEQGTQVLVYACSSESVKDIYKAFTSQPKNQLLKQMITYIKQVDPDCVVFNWECSSGYSSQAFGEGSANVFGLAKMMVDRGHMVMFSDFSLKALIAQWDQKLMGPNPFVKVSQFGGDFKLEFDANQLKECPSAQLQIIGDMASVGHCNVNAMGGTIVYGVDKKKADTDAYKLQVLTIVTSITGNQNYYCQINGKKGLAGHVLLTYKSGGHVLVSMGHWAQLMKIDTSDKVLFEIAAREYGEVKAQQMQMQYANISDVNQKQAYISRNAVEFVQSSAPCANMSKKAKMQKF